jgi:hypothetical protein
MVGRKDLITSRCGQMLRYFAQRGEMTCQGTLYHEWQGTIVTRRVNRDVGSLIPPVIIRLGVY